MPPPLTSCHWDGGLHGWTSQDSHELTSIFCAGGNTFGDMSNKPNRGARIEASMLSQSEGSTLADFMKESQDASASYSPRQRSPTSNANRSFSHYSGSQRTIIGSAVYANTSAAGAVAPVPLVGYTRHEPPTQVHKSDPIGSAFGAQKQLLEAIAQLTCSPLGFVGSSLVPQSLVPLQAVERLECQSIGNNDTLRKTALKPTSSSSPVLIRASLHSTTGGGLTAAVASAGHSALMIAPEHTAHYLQGDYYLLPEGLTPAQRFGMMRSCATVEFPEVRHGGRKHERQGRVLASNPSATRRPPWQGKVVAEEALGDTVSSVGGDTLRQTVRGPVTGLGASVSVHRQSPPSSPLADAKSADRASEGLQVMSPIGSLLSILDMGVDPARVLAMLER